MISFEFECWLPFGLVTVEANDDGSKLRVFDKSGEDVFFTSLCGSDRCRILARVQDEVAHLRAMDEPHPAMEGFGDAYVDWINDGSP